MKYRKKPVVVEASRWFKMGDDPGVVQYNKGADLLRECEHCGERMAEHGWIKTLEGGHIVCPGDWIVTGIEKERYPVKNGIFRNTYEEVPKDE
jgi:hypothetical protein